MAEKERKGDAEHEGSSRLSPMGVALIALSLIGLVAGFGFLGWRLSQPTPIAPGQAAAFCRPCTDLVRLESMFRSSLARSSARGADGIEAADRERVVAAVGAWRRRCATLMCNPRSASEPGCAAPSAALLTELAAIESLTEGLAQRTAKCARGGCQSTRCEPALSAADAFGMLQGELRRLAENPPALAGERHELATGFVFDEIESLSNAVLTAPALAAEARYAPAEARLLFLRDAALASGANVPGSAEGLLADRLDEIAHAINALAKAKRMGVGGPMLAAIWRDLADSSARLLLETASFKAHAPARANAFAGLISPPAAALSAAGGRGVCEGAVRLVQSTEQKLTAAMSQLAMCNLRAACHPEDDATAAVRPRLPVQPRTITEQLSARSGAAAEALRGLFFNQDEDVALETDLARYSAREAIAVRPLAETNRCLADRGARILLAPDGEAAPLEVHSLDPSDSGAWLFEAPRQSGRYRIVLRSPRERGEGIFGASPPFEVAPAPSGCEGFTGTWQTDLGLLTVRVREGAARGSYRHGEEDDRAGILIGAVDGRTLTGTWHSELGAGGTRLALSEDGRSFSGTWSQLLDRVAGTGKWEGHCLARAATDDTPPPPAGGGGLK